MNASSLGKKIAELGAQVAFSSIVLVEHPGTRRKSGVLKSNTIYIYGVIKKALNYVTMANSWDETLVRIDLILYE